MFNWSKRPITVSFVSLATEEMSSLKVSHDCNLELVGKNCFWDVWTPTWNEKHNNQLLSFLCICYAKMKRKYISCTILQNFEVMHCWAEYISWRVCLKKALVSVRCIRQTCGKYKNIKCPVNKHCSYHDLFTYLGSVEYNIFTIW
jgi:hypothetical protein